MTQECDHQKMISLTRPPVKSLSVKAILQQLMQRLSHRQMQLLRTSRPKEAKSRETKQTGKPSGRPLNTRKQRLHRAKSQAQKFEYEKCLRDMRRSRLQRKAIACSTPLRRHIITGGRAKSDDVQEKNPEQAHRQLRAACAGNLRRYTDTWLKWWDGKDPSDRDCASFEAYIDIINQPKTWGVNLEAEACAKVLRAQIYVLTEDPAFEPFAINASYRTSIKLLLWYTGSHYDWLKPSSDGVITKDFLQQFSKNKTGTGGRGGGGSVVEEKQTTNMETERVTLTKASSDSTQRCVGNEGNEQEEMWGTSPPVTSVPRATCVMDPSGESRNGPAYDAIRMRMRMRPAS